MSRPELILKKLERQLMKIMSLLAKTEPQADLAFCEKQAKTLAVVIKALENIRAMQLANENEGASIVGAETAHKRGLETDQEFRQGIAQKLTRINQKEN